MKKILKILIPAPLRGKFYKYRGKWRLPKLRVRILKYLKEESRCDDPEIAEIVDFLEKNPLKVFPYDFMKKYDHDKIEVYTDRNNGLKYVMHENKRLYFRRGWKEKSIRQNYNGLLAEQDIDSPHCYTKADFHVEQGDVIVDVGSADGNFALSNVEKAKKVYLFEVTPLWIEALEATFAPWKDKVEIVCKYVSDSNDGNCVTLDKFFGKESVNFIKADIEGAEIALLNGGREVLSGNDKLKVVLCTYHRQDDAQQLESMLTESGFKTEFSKGYMIFTIAKKILGAPYLRRGLIRGRKM